MATNRLWAGYLCLTAAVFLVASLAGDGLVQATGALLGISAVAAVVIGVDLFDPHPRWPWLLLAVGQLCFALGDATAILGHSAPTAASFPSIPEFLYLAAYPIVTLGFTLLVVRRPLGGAGRSCSTAGC